MPRRKREDIPNAILKILSEEESGLDIYTILNENQKLFERLGITSITGIRHHLNQLISEGKITSRTHDRKAYYFLSEYQRRFPQKQQSTLDSFFSEADEKDVKQIISSVSPDKLSSIIEGADDPAKEVIKKYQQKKGVKKVRDFSDVFKNEEEKADISGTGKIRDYSKDEVFEETQSFEERTETFIDRTITWLQSHDLLRHNTKYVYEAREKLLEYPLTQFLIDFFLDRALEWKHGPKYARKMALNELKIVFEKGLGIGREILDWKELEEQIERNPNFSMDNIDPKFIDAIESCTFGETVLSKKTSLDLQNHEKILKNIKEKNNPSSNFQKLDWIDIAVIAGSDASQRQGELQFPSIEIYFSIPFLVTNSSGLALYGPHKAKIRRKPGKIFKLEPRLYGHPSNFREDIHDFKDQIWPYIGPELISKMDPHDLKWVRTSSLDAGQYFIEDNAILKDNEDEIDVLFRDGRIFPSDNFVVNYQFDEHSDRYKYTRNALRNHVRTLDEVRNQGVLYVGVVKSAMLLFFSTLFTWFLKRENPKIWKTLQPFSDNQMMTYFLHSEKWNGNFDEVYVTFGVERTYSAVSNVHLKKEDWLETQINKLGKFKGTYRKALEISKVVMFYIGHAREPTFRLPRYEYYPCVDYDNKENFDFAVKTILSSIRKVSLDIDNDHGFEGENPLLVPSVILEAHKISKQINEEFKLAVQTFIYKEYLRRKNQLKSQ